MMIKFSAQESIMTHIDLTLSSFIIEEVHQVIDEDDGFQFLVEP